MLCCLSCRNTKQLVDKEFLLNKNSIKVDNSKVNSEDLSSYIKQKPNRKILGLFRFHLTVYSIGNKGKENRIKKWMKNTIGEAPVILDTFLTDKSVKQMILYLNNKGYFTAKVSRSFVYNTRKKKVQVIYNVKAFEAYKVLQVNYEIEDQDIRSFVINDTNNSLLKAGKNYDVDELQTERDRITKNLKENGYYEFSKEYITYRIDSSLNSVKLKITCKINQSKTKVRLANSDSIIITNHPRFLIQKIYIYPDYKTLQLDTIKYDTIKVSIAQRKKSSIPNTYYFIVKENAPIKVKFKTLTQSVFIEPGQYFNIKDVDRTYKRLSDLRFYKFINITFNNSENDSMIDGMKLLDCRIQLTRTATQSINYEFEGTNSSGDLGIAGNVVYQNKNFFKGAEIFSVKAKGALEVRRISGQKDPSDLIYAWLPFNTVETGLETGLDIPKFFVPIRAERFPKYFKPKTSIQAGLNYQKRPDYTRYITNVSFGYDWKENEKKRHILNPVEINSVKIKLDPLFEQSIAGLSERLKSGYKDHLTTALKYTFLFSNQLNNKSKKFVFFRGSFEAAGNLLSAISKPLGFVKKDNDYYTVFGIRYAQYLRADADFRHFNKINKNTTFAYRTAFGIGFPYGNLPVMPFEKSFFVGGANDIRAWQIRTLGPGSFNDSLNSVLDKTGDIMLEGNIEYRFGIYHFLQGAAFVDAGNVWLMYKNAKFKDGEFLLNNFYKQIAIGAGLGIRLDFSFFVFRIDAAAPLKNPVFPEGNRWQVKSLTFKDINLNLGIGYPF